MSASVLTPSALLIRAPLAAAGGSKEKAIIPSGAMDAFTSAASSGVSVNPTKTFKYDGVRYEIGDVMDAINARDCANNSDDTQAVLDGRILPAGTGQEAGGYQPPRSSVAPVLPPAGDLVSSAWQFKQPAPQLNRKRKRKKLEDQAATVLGQVALAVEAAMVNNVKASSAPGVGLYAQQAQKKSAEENGWNSRKAEEQYKKTKAVKSEIECWNVMMDHYVSLGWRLVKAQRGEDPDDFLVETLRKRIASVQAALASHEDAPSSSPLPP